MLSTLSKNCSVVSQSCWGPTNKARSFVIGKSTTGETSISEVNDQNQSLINNINNNAINATNNIAIPARIPIIATTTSSSIKVKPLFINGLY